jgi:hypothetical protein
MDSVALNDMIIIVNSDSVNAWKWLWDVWCTVLEFALKNCGEPFEISVSRTGHQIPMQKVSDVFGYSCVEVTLPWELSAMNDAISIPVRLHTKWINLK